MANGACGPATDGRPGRHSYLTVWHKYRDIRSNILDPIAIRKILESIETLMESTGLAGRKPGDQFKDSSTGEVLTFNDLKFYPEEGGKFEQGDLDQAVKQIESQAGQKIQWENSPSSRTGGFAIASLTDGDKPVLVGTYLQSIKPNFTDNYVANIILKKYKFGGKAAEKTQAGLTPQDLLKNQLNLTVKDIMVQLAEKLGTDSPLYYVAHQVASGNPLPIEIPAPAGISFTAFRDYFCEILQPIALHTGLYTGNAGDAAEEFLAPEGFQGTLINFDSSKNAGLADSVLELPDGRIVKVSSKGNKGAEASVKNLLDSVDELKQSQSGQKLIRKYKSIIEVLDGVKTAGQAGAPLYLGVMFDIIDSSEAQIIRGLKNSAPVDITDTAALKEMGLTKNLIKLVEERGTKTPQETALYYHLIASVAHKAAEKINNDTDFSKAASTILNNGALVQVYTKATERKDKWILNNFDTVYPGSAVTGVMFSAQKNYSSTSIKGNFTFKILRGNAKVAPDDNTEAVPTPAPATDGSDRERKAVNLKARTEPSAGAGRERR